MNYLSPYLDGPPGGKLKLATVTQLGLGMAVSIWEFNVGAVIAILGIMAVVSSNEEYLKLYFFFTPGAILIDIIQLLTYPRQSLWVILMFASVLAKLAGMYFSWDLMNMSGGDGLDYQQAWSGPTPGQQSQHVSYNPPQQPPPSQQQHPPQQQHAPPAQNEGGLV